jgi:prolyl-tRNA synthetase
MQDGKALQAGTSHFLGQNFAKAFDVKFMTKEGSQAHVWATSWGVSTRLMGALIMTHSDDQGLVLPPNLAPYHVVIVPIYKNEDQLNAISALADTIMTSLRAKNISVKYDNRTTQRPGAKFAQYELQGVPLRIAIGPNDLENGTVELARRDTLSKITIDLEKLQSKVNQLIAEIQDTLYVKALKFRDQHITLVDNFEAFKSTLETKGGFVSAHWDGSEETEQKIKELTKASIRCIPMDAPQEEGKCVFSGALSKQRVLFAKAY